MSLLLLFPGNADLMISEEVTPGAAAEHEGLHQCAFGLDSVHQVVGCPCVEHFFQDDGAKSGMLYHTFQVFILDLLEQAEAFLAALRECRSKLLRSL